jgi:serine/threonine protein kinase
MSSLQSMQDPADGVNAYQGKNLKMTVIAARLDVRNNETGNLTRFVWKPDAPIAKIFYKVAAENNGRMAPISESLPLMEFDTPGKALNAAKSLQEQLRFLQVEEAPEDDLIATLVVRSWDGDGPPPAAILTEIDHALETTEPGQISLNDDTNEIASSLPSLEPNGGPMPAAENGNGTSAPISHQGPADQPGENDHDDATSTPAAAHSNLPRHARYEIIAEIGRGAMGVVYKAHDRSIGRIVALKTIPVDSRDMGRTELMERLQREAKAAGSLDHPNIITIYDVGEEDDLVYLSMQFVEGETFSSVLSEKKLLPLPVLLSYVDQICNAVGFAHQCGIIHRDLKPSNLMLTPQGGVKVLDFGIAKSGDAGMTQAGMVIGTPDYMAPEQAAGRRVDQRSDIFTLGAVFYELFTSEKAFSGQSITAVLYKVMNEDPVPPSVIEPSLPRGIDAVIQRALAKDPQQRFQSCEEMREAFRQQGLLLGVVYGTQIAPAQTTTVTNGQYAVATAAASNGVSATNIFGAGSAPSSLPYYSQEKQPLTTKPKTYFATHYFATHKVTLFAWIAGATGLVAVLAMIVGINALRKKPDPGKSSTVNPPLVRSAPVPDAKPVPLIKPQEQQTTPPVSQPVSQPVKQEKSKIPVEHPPQHASKTAAPKSARNSVPASKPPVQTTTQPAQGEESVGGFSRAEIPGMLAKADAAYGKGDYGTALNIYGMVLRMDPQNTDAIAGKNRTLDAQKDRARNY